jgi:LPXTG-site transpeptidase (sortase) family protein
MNLAFSGHEARTSTPKPSKKVFAAVFVVLFFLSFSAADSVGFVPYYIDGSAPRNIALDDLPELGNKQQPVAVATNTQPAVETAIAPVKPERIVVSSIDLDLPIQNPSTRDIDALDEVLKKGPARYVDSALLGQKGNMLIFAHTSHLPVVHNQMYKAFNRLPELESGDTITITGGGKKHLYSVTKVRRADAEEELIDLSPTGNRLTLVTCDTLTSKSSRWVIEAELVGTY